MIRRLSIFFIIILGVFYVGSGIYFYHKSSRKIIIPPSPKIITVFNVSDLIVLNEINNDFEDEKNNDNTLISSENPYSGKKSIRILPVNEYGAEVNTSCSEIPSLKQLRQVEVTFKIWNNEINQNNLWVLEVDGENGKVVDWNSDELPKEKHKWITCSFRYDIKFSELKNFNRIKTYAWNRNKNKFFIDDLRVRFLGLPPENKSTFYSTLSRSSFFFDLENDSSLEKTKSLTDEISHSGKHSSLMDGKNEFSVWVCKKVKDVMNDTITAVDASVWLYPTKDNIDCSFQFEVRDTNDEQIYQNEKGTANMKLKAGVWQKLNAEFNFYPEDYRRFTDDDRICIYILNKSKSKLYADDFEVSYGNIPDRRGIQTYVDMNALQNRTYQFNRYHPPFPFSYLRKKDIQNDNSQYLINSDSTHYGNLTPDQFMFRGNFTGAANDKDELLVFTGKSFELYYFCENKHRFIISGIVPFNIDTTQDIRFLSGDFNGDKKDELILISDHHSTMYEFSGELKQHCTDNFQELKMTSLWSGSISTGDEKIFSGYFTGNKNAEIFIADKPGHYVIKKFTGKEWNIIADDTISPLFFGKESSQVCGKFFSTTHDVILSAYHEKNSTKCRLFELDGNKLRIKHYPGEEMTDNLFSYNDKLFSVHSKGKSYDDIFSFNDQWRFEIKNISIDSKGFYISSIPEFIGFTADNNPKYYEFPKLILGKFTGNETEVLCILRNCADKNFDGIHCKSYDSIPDLPNTVQLYYFSK